MPAAGESSPPAQPVGVAAEVVRVYQVTRLWLALGGLVVVLAAGFVTGWERGSWVLVAPVLPLVHALLVRSRSTGILSMLIVDFTALGFGSLALSVPAVTAMILAFQVVLLALLVDRAAAFWLAPYGVAWGATGFASAHWNWFEPFSDGTEFVLQLSAVGFFLPGIGWVLLRVLAESRRLAAQRLSAEKALRAEETRFRTMIENAFDGVGIIGPSGSLDYISESITRILGYSTDQRLGQPMHDIVVEEDVPIVLGRLAEISRVPDASTKVEVRVKHADGSTRILDVVAHNMLDEPSVGGIVANFRDVTEQANALAALEESNARLEQLVRSKDEFVASVSHELRTPLTAVLGLAEELRDHDDNFTAQERTDLRDVIAVQAREVAAIVEDLRVAARADIGAVAVIAEPCDVGVALDEVLTVLEPGHDVAVSVEGEVVALADRGRCRQVVRNLITNALRYGGPNVKLDAWSDGKSAHLAVRDDGRGLSGEDAARVFEPYESAHHERTQPASIGLGLTVSRQLARLMKGDLVYYVRDGWSTFELTLPLAP